MASHDEIEKYVAIFTALAALGTTIWGVLTYRIWDMNKLVHSKVGVEKFDEEMGDTNNKIDSEVKEIRREQKNDLRYIEEKIGNQILLLAEDLKKEIRSLK